MMSELRKWIEAYDAKVSRVVAGLMSGTSRDGLDVAICRISGSGKTSKAELLHFDCYKFPTQLQEHLDHVCSGRVSLLEMMKTDELLARFSAQSVHLSVKNADLSMNDLDLVASHGQTVWHTPSSAGEAARTLQIGEGDWLASALDTPVISDFRRRQIARGGEGAPLAPYGEYLLFGDRSETMAFLNLGGIANLSVLSGKPYGRVFATDCGPANIMIDQFMKETFHQSFDKDGLLGSQGKPIPALHKHLTAHAFFASPLPKSTGPEAFNLSLIPSEFRELEAHDILRTLYELSVFGIKSALSSSVKQANNVYVSGGGWNNLFLMERIRDEMPEINFLSAEEVGIPVEAKEAILFAVLANQTLCGSPADFEKTGLIPTSFGKLSLPR